MCKTNRNYKDSVFTHLFRDPAREYELYSAVAPGRIPPGAVVKDVTLSGIVYKDRVNDLSFLVGDKLVVFFEHQGSINDNMPLRDLIYCGRVYEMIIAKTSIYSENRVMIPTPEFYVLYNGVRPFPEKAVLRLSDSYKAPPAGEPALDLVVQVFNVNAGFNEDMVRRSEALSGYVTLVSTVREYEKAGMPMEDAVKAAIVHCIKSGILVEYLEKHASEVINMVFQEWDWDMARKVWESEAEARERAKFEPLMAKKDAKIRELEPLLAEKDAEIRALKARLSQSGYKS